MKIKSMRAGLAMLIGASAIGVGGAAVAQITPWGTGPVTRAQYIQWFQQQLIAADANSDGVVTVEEQRAYRQKQCAKVAGALFESGDVNRNGALERDEWVALYTGQLPTDQVTAPGGKKMCSQLRAGWRMRGSRPDGSIVIKTALADAEARFTAADANKDGTVTPAERQAYRANKKGFNRRMPSPPPAPGQ